MIARVSTLILAIAMVTVTVSHAAILFVSPNPGSAPYSTIGAAIGPAVSGDTIVVGPGTYTGFIQINSEWLHIIGAGWDVCVFNGYADILNSGANGTTIEGLKFQAGGATHTLTVRNNADSVLFRRCHVTPQPGWYPVNCAHGRVYLTDCAFVGTSNGCVSVSSVANGNLVVRNCVFTLQTPAASYYAFNGTNGGVIEIYNCAFLNFRNVFNVTGVPQVIGLNNIFWDWDTSPGFGTLPVGSVFEYSAKGSGAPAWPANFANNIDLASNNPFVNYDNSYYQYPTHNLNLNTNTGGNLCRDAGYPSIQDLDSTAADLGVYGGPKPFVNHGIPAFPFALTLDIDNLVEVGDSVNVTSSGRIGPRY